MTTEPFPCAARLRVLLFDAGNTLLWIDHARLADLLRDAGIECDEASVREAEMRARPQLDPHLGHAPKRETPEIFGLYMGFALAHLGIAADDPRCARAAAPIRSSWRSLWARVPDDALETLGELRRRGYRLGVVSNSDGTVGRQLDDAGLEGWFECIVDSGKEGVEKPDPRIFALAAERLDVDPSHCAYVGDFHSLDVLGARGAGMEGILIDPIGAWDAVDAPRIRALSDLLDRVLDPAPR